jgi:hypothetical protein
MPEGKIVAEYKLNSCTVRISDAAYAGVSEAELRRRRAEANRIAWEIAVRHEMRETDGT